MMNELEKLEVGLNNVEAFNLGLISKLRSETMKGKGEEIKRKFFKYSIRIKIRDEERYHEEMMKMKNKLRRD